MLFFFVWERCLDQLVYYEDSSYKTQKKQTESDYKQ